MAEESMTKNLGLPLILGSDYVMRGKINDVIKTIDGATLPKSHMDSKAHFDLWQENTAYKKQDVVKTTTCPSWGFYMCAVAGTSGTVAPEGVGEGDIRGDGTIVWVLKKLGGGAQDSGLDYWRSNKIYEKSALVLYNRLLYRCTAEHESKVTFEPVKWQLINTGYLPDWTQSTAYEKNMLAVHDKNIHRCLNYHTSYDFKADKQRGNWETILTYGAIVSDWQALKMYEKGETIFEKDCLYRANATHTSSAIFNDDTLYWELLANKKVVIGDWATSTNYKVNECVIYNLHLYRCKTTHLSTAFTADAIHWELINVNRLVDWQPGYNYEKDELSRYLGFTYRAKTAHTSGAIFTMMDWQLIDACYIPDWRAGVSYEPEMTVVKDHMLHRCKTAHTAAIFANETVNWEQISSAGASIWQAGQNYNAGQIVFRNGLIYSCTVAH